MGNRNSEGERVSVRTWVCVSERVRKRDVEREKAEGVMCSRARKINKLSFFLKQKPISVLNRINVSL